MPGLRDIAKKLRKTVVIAGEEVPVRGLTATELAELIAEYPQFGHVMLSAWDRMDTEAMREQAPACVARMIAIGTSLNGHAPSEEDIVDAASLPGLASLDLLSAIAELTLPRAVTRPFVAVIADGNADADS